MYKILIPKDVEFVKYEQEIKELYYKNQDLIGDSSSFEYIRDNTFFYLLVVEDKPTGAIYYFLKDKKLWLNAFSIRKNHKYNLEFLTQSLEWFNCDIYAEARNRMSALCLLKVGFKSVEKNSFVLKKRNL